MIFSHSILVEVKYVQYIHRFGTIKRLRQGKNLNDNFFKLLEYILTFGSAKRK
jgi:hypothetical protein